MITIGIDASRANRTEKTGVEWYSYYLIQEMKKLIPPGYRVILYSAEPLHGDLAVLPPNWASKIIRGLNIGRGPWLWTQLGLSWEMLCCRLKSFARHLAHPKLTEVSEGVDILFVPSHAIPLIHPKRTYTTIHDIGFEVFPESYEFLARLYHRWSARFALRHAHRVFTPSEFTKQELVKYYRANPKKIIVTPLGFDASLYHPRSEEEIESLIDTRYPMLKNFDAERSIPGVPKSKVVPYILYIGRVEKKKNVKRLIEAFLELKKETPSPQLSSRPERSEAEGSLKLVITGSPGFGYEEIKAAAKDSKDIIFTGWIPAEDLPVILAGAALYALPSLYEGFGIPILEAMASGVPVLTSNTASMPEVACKITPSPLVGEGGERGKNCAAHLVNPESITDIKSGIKRILEDSFYRANLISAGLNRAKDFSWSKTAQITLNNILSVDK